MLRHLVLIAAALAIIPSPASAQDGGYFTKGETQLTYHREGSRSTNEKIVVASIFGTSLLAAGIGTYYLRDSNRLSDSLSASGTHTGKAWSAQLEQTRKDAVQAGTFAKVGYGLTFALVLAGIVTYIVTEPDEEVAYQDWQTRSFVIPSQDGVLAGRAWSF